jgi:UDP-N-acetylmuramoyl-tripeptide--D-alanyl-D-alanine ligase
MSRPLWTRDEIIQATGGQGLGPDFAATGLAIDTRELETGDLFIALAGLRDGHDFIDQARNKGAAAALVSQPVIGPAVQVPEVLAGLEQMGVYARKRASAARRGAITGSVGKTSLTQAVAAGLAMAGHGHASVKSFNNHIGVPLTLARMPANTQRAVFELGMNHAGEIEPLSRMVAPHAVCITTVGPVHIENFADGEAGVAKAKAEIFAGLEPGGTAILNADNHWFEMLRERAHRVGARVLSFGAADSNHAQLADIQASGSGSVVTAVLNGKTARFPILQMGSHWGHNCLAAILMMQALGLDQDLAIAALGQFEPLAGRGAERMVKLADGQFCLIDESYNANPVSMAAALKTLGARQTTGRRIAVLSDMLELGDAGPALHAQVSQAITAARIDRVYCCGPLMKSLWQALEPAQRGGYAPDADGLAGMVTEAVAPGDLVMVKGSNGSKASQIAKALVSMDIGGRG